MLSENRFKAQVYKRAQQIVQQTLQSSIETMAVKQARDILKDLGLPVPRKLTHPKVNGKARMKRPHSRKPSAAPIVKNSSVLVRGKVQPSDKLVRKNSDLLRLSGMAWASLHENGKFRSGRATRSDMEAYLKSSFRDVNPASIQPSVSSMISKGFLAVDNGL